MTITGMALQDATRGYTYTLIPSDQLKVGQIEVTPSVRESVASLAAMDGTDDQSAYLGAAAVTLNLTVICDVADTLDALAGFCVPWSRPYLLVTDDEWAWPRKIQLRFDSQSHPQVSGSYRSVQLAWKAPRGVWEDTAVQRAVIGADVPETTGMVIAATGLAVTSGSGYLFPATTAGGSSVLLVHGNARPAWRVRLYGPATGPKLSRDDTSQVLAFTDGLILGAGEYVELDSAARTVRLLSQAAQPRLSYLDFTVSEWFPLDPGPNQLRYYATAGTGPGSVADLSIWPVWLP